MSITQRMLQAAKATFRHELRILLRDPFCLALLLCFSVGLAWASWSSYSHWRGFAIQQTNRQAEAREKWLSQSTANAHMATHVGQTVYKPISPLAGFDPGALAEHGSKIFVQSHHQSAAKKPPIDDRIELLKNETYSPAVLLEFIGPLLIIVLGISSIGREKEGGTLSILLTTGSPWAATALGKGFAILLALFFVAIPGLLLLFIPWFEIDGVLDASNLLIRQAVILVLLTAYYAGWLGATMWVSSKSRSMTGSFSILIALWSVFALVMPRIAGDVATFASPLPTIAEVRLEKENAVHDANQSSVAKAEATRDLEASLLEEYKVDRIEDLPIDMAGARMIQQEANANRLYDEIEQRTEDAKNRQNEIIRAFQFASPFMAMRAASTSFAATDRMHHFDFVNDAENYRRKYVKDLNTSEMKKQRPGKSPEEKREFWGRVSAFQPTLAASSLDLRRSILALICIFFWTSVAVTASLCSCPKVGR